MKIVVLTSDTDRKNETAIVNGLFEVGLERLHIRKPGYNISEYKKFITSVDEKFHSRLVLHGGGFELWNEFSLGGIHLTSVQRGHPPVEIERISKLQLSSSFHKWSEIRFCSIDFGYIIISPVFDSISKTNYKAGVDFRGLEKMRKSMEEEHRPLPEVIGLGGVDIPHLHILKEHHFDGAAVYGAVWKANDPVTFMKHMLQFA